MEDMMKQQTDCYPPHYTIPRRGKAKPPGGVLVGDVTDQHKSFYKRADPHHNLSMVHFEKQPPDNTRKTFFHFVISLFDQNHQAVEVLKASFKDFCDTTENGQEYRNGLIYKLYVSYSDGVQKEEELHIRLIDSSTKQLIPYEGTCKSPDFRRVLLTHEVICSRCLEHRSCGNKKETPSDPILIDRYRLKFFVKCNQNCLKNAGNPKDSRRRFQVAVYIPPNSDTPIGCSDAMFVHNNSKHGQKANPVREAMVGDGKPYIISVHPHEGCMTGGSSVCIIGMNFYEGTEVVFGTLPAASELISPCAIAVKTPPSPRSGEVDITLVYQGSQYCIKKFVYLAPDEAHFEHNFARLERLLRNPEEPDDIPKDNLLKRAADALETFYSLPWPNYSGGGDAGPLTHGNQPVGSGQHFFSFPTTQADAKIEHMSSIHKPKPVTPGGVYPVAKVAHMPQGMYGYPSSSGDMNGFMANNMGEHHESNRNNNNSNIGFGHPMVAAGWHGNPIHLIPPSPPTASPGPLPLTPNGPGGSTVFNFSPAKPMRSVLQGNKGGKTSDGLLHPAAGGGATIHYQQTMLADLTTMSEVVTTSVPFVSTALQSMADMPVKKKRRGSPERKLF